MRRAARAAETDAVIASRRHRIATNRAAMRHRAKPQAPR